MVHTEIVLHSADRLFHVLHEWILQELFSTNKRQCLHFDVIFADFKKLALKIRANGLYSLKCEYRATSFIHEYLPCCRSCDTIEVTEKAPLHMTIHCKGAFCSELNSRLGESR